MEEHETISYFYIEWQTAKRLGDDYLAKFCKQSYETIVNQAKKVKYKQYLEGLKPFPMIYLN